jgi:hypothetical protein
MKFYFSDLTVIKMNWPGQQSGFTKPLEREPTWITQRPFTAKMHSQEIGTHSRSRNSCTPLQLWPIDNITKLK